MGGNKKKGSHVFRFTWAGNRQERHGKRRDKKEGGRIRDCLVGRETKLFRKKLSWSGERRQETKF